MNNLITVLRDPREGASINKLVDADGGEFTASSQERGVFIAKTLEINALKELQDLLADLKPDEVVMFGSFKGQKDGDRLTVLPEKDLRQRLKVGPDEATGIHQIDGKTYTARLAANVTPSRWKAIDVDATDSTPAEWVAAMREHVPGFAKAHVLTKSSCKSQVQLDGKPVFPGSSFHAYVHLDGTNPDFGTDLKIQQIVAGHSIVSDVCSRKTGEVIAKQVRPSLYDHAAMTAANRIWYEGPPTLTEAAAAAVVVPAEFELHTGGGEGWHQDQIETPDSATVRQFKEITGAEVHRAWNGQKTTCSVVEQTLQLDEEIETEEGVMTVEAYIASDHGKIRAQAHRRGSESWNAFLFRDPAGMPRFHDNGAQVTYRLPDDVQAELAWSQLKAVYERMKVEKRDFEASQLLDDTSLMGLYRHLDAGKQVQLRGAVKAAGIAVGTFDELAAASTNGLSSKHPEQIAEAFLNDRRMVRDGRYLLRRTEGQFYRYVGTHWLAVRDEEVLMAEISDYMTAAGLGVTGAKLKDAMQQLKLLTISDTPLNQWSTGRKGDYIALKNGILELESGKLLPHSPDYFGLSCGEYSYDPDAKAEKWLKFLDEVYEKDAECIAALQQWFGYYLTSDTSQEKALALVGESRGGKGVIAAVLTAMVGPDAVGGTSLTKLGTNFGLQPLLGKRLAISAETRVGSGHQTNAQGALEKLLMIIGGDHVDIDRKSVIGWSGPLPIKFLLQMNQPPMLKDESGALMNRLCVIPHNVSFAGKEDTTLKTKLLEEMPGVLNWAIEGLKQMKLVSCLEPTTAAAETRQQIADELDPVGQFLRECCRVGGEEQETTDWTLHQLHEWLVAQGRRPSITKTTLTQSLKKHGIHRVRGPGDSANDHKRPYVYRGIRLLKEHTGPIDWKPKSGSESGTSVPDSASVTHLSKPTTDGEEGDA